MHSSLRSEQPHQQLISHVQRFELGEIAVSRALHEAMQSHLPFSEWMYHCLCRHSRLDWGDLSDHDKRLNDLSATGDETGRILSSYDLPESMAEVIGHQKLWINTEWDRSVTTLLFPSDY